MHIYGTDSPERTRVAATLALCSVPLAWGTHLVAQAVTLPWFWLLDVPSVLGYFGVLTLVFDRWAWRWRWLRLIDLVRVPVLDGYWVGEIHSTYRQGTDVQLALIIRQTWSRIGVSAETGSSRSHSVVTAILTAHGDPTLVYLYLNEPRPGAASTMHAHRGTAELRLVGDSPPVLEGAYFTGRDREQQGTVRVKFTAKVPPTPSAAASP